MLFWTVPKQLKWSRGVSTKLLHVGSQGLRPIHTMYSGVLYGPGIFCSVEMEEEGEEDEGEILKLSELSLLEI